MKRKCPRKNANYYLCGALQESKQHNNKGLFLEIAHCLSDSGSSTLGTVELWNICVSISKKPNFDAKFFRLHWHVLLEGKPSI